MATVGLMLRAIFVSFFWILALILGMVGIVLGMVTHVLQACLTACVAVGECFGDIAFDQLEEIKAQRRQWPRG